MLLEHLGGSGAGMEYLVCGVSGRMVMLLWSLLFTFCVSERMVVLLWSMFGVGDGNAGAGAEHVVCVLHIWEDGGAAMEYVVCFCGKGEGKEEKE